MKNTDKKKTGIHTNIFAFRTDDETAQKIREDASLAGMSPGRYIRERMAGRHISAKYDLQLLNEIRRQGGLLKHLATHGLDTEEALQTVITTMRKVQQMI